jgi:hypothetical protein
LLADPDKARPPAATVSPVPDWAPTYLSETNDFSFEDSS